MTERDGFDNRNEDVRTIEGMTAYFEAHRSRFERIVRFRMDPAFRARMDVSDVLQEAYLDVLRRFAEWPKDGSLSAFIWLRQRVLQALWDLQRNHSREKRAVQRERVVAEVWDSDSTSISLASYLVDDLTSPSHAAIKREDRRGLHAALERLSELDREVLALRHFEQLSNVETAQALSLTPTAASNRYVRATIRLAELMQSSLDDSQSRKKEMN